MNKVTVSDAQENLPALLEQLAPGETILIVVNDQAIARLTREKSSIGTCKAGSAKTTEHWMADDFDAPLDDFVEYM
jgi:antitoxin (DNA-binding transcriptional repressor) of toxin-antitoxin stability system